MEFLDDEIETLNEIIQNKKILLKFGAVWCKNCDEVKNCLKEYCEKNNYFLVSIDVDVNPSIMEHYNVEKLPTVIVLDGNPMEKIVGAQNIKNKFEIISIVEDF